MNRTIKALITFIAVLLLWWAISATNIFPESLFPSPGATATALAERASSGALLLDIGASMYRFFIGYIMACVSAIVLGLILGWLPRVWSFVNPLVQFLRPISPVAWLPFIVLWVGIGDVPAIVIIFLAAFFPVLLTTVRAVRTVDPIYLNVSRTFGLGSAQTLLKIVLPAVFPQIANGLHIALGTAWIFLVAGEMAGTQSGLGFLITDARNNMQVDMLMAAIVVIGILGVVLDWVIGQAERSIGQIWGTGTKGAQE